MNKRKQLRLDTWNYSTSGYYFVTICVQNREHLFGKIMNGEILLSDAGSMINSTWNELCCYYQINVDAYVVMPNHFHAIIKLPVGATLRGCPIQDGQAQRPTPTLTLSDIVHRFKSLTTTRYRHNVLKNNWQPFPGRLWQRNFYDHIIRNEKSLNEIQKYINENPIRRGNPPWLP